MVIGERIVCAAMRDPKTKQVYLCVRHGDDLFWDQVRGTHGNVVDCIGYEQGFITNRKRYVDRKEAFKIATEQGQIIRAVGGNGLERLYSENLY